eukprot:5283258-Pleurochrysis_carterae.AAC.1
MSASLDDLCDETESSEARFETTSCNRTQMACSDLAVASPPLLLPKLVADRSRLARLANRDNSDSSARDWVSSSATISRLAMHA